MFCNFTRIEEGSSSISFSKFSESLLCIAEPKLTLLYNFLIWNIVGNTGTRFFSRIYPRPKVLHCARMPSVVMTFEILIDVGFTVTVFKHTLYSFFILKMHSRSWIYMYSLNKCMDMNGPVSNDDDSVCGDCDYAAQRWTSERWASLCVS